MSEDDPTEAMPFPDPDEQGPVDPADLDQRALDRLAAELGAAEDEPQVSSSEAGSGDAGSGDADSSDADADSMADAEVRALLAGASSTGKGADTELALAHVKDASRHRKVRDRTLVAGGVAAVLLVLVFVAAWQRSDGSGELETADGGRTTATTARTRPSVGDASVYSGDPGDSASTGTTVAPAVAAPSSVSTTSVPGVSTTTTTRVGGPNPSQPAANPPVLQLAIHAEAGSVKAGDRAWFTVQVHNSGGEGTYEGNDCGTGHIRVTLSPALPTGQPVTWSGDAPSFAGAVAQGGGGIAQAPLAGPQQAGRMAHPMVACPAVSQSARLAPGETITEKVSIDVAPPPGKQVAATYTATAEFSVSPVDPSGAPIKATDTATLNVTGSVPTLPGATALQAVVSTPAVNGWVGSQGGPFVMQTRYYRGAWELLLSAAQPSSPDSEILRIRLDAAGTVIDVRAVRTRSAASDDPGATAPVVGERKLYP